MESGIIEYMDRKDITLSNIIKYIYHLAIILIAWIVFLCTPVLEIHAAPPNVHFGSESYSLEYGMEFPIGVYLETEDNIGAYEIRLSYDATIIEYQRGANASETGTIILSGELQGSPLKVFLYFNSIAMGDTVLKVESASVQGPDEADELTVDMLPIAPITIAPSTEDLPETLYCNGIEVTGFASDVTMYDMTVPYAEEFVVTDDEGVPLSVEVVENSEFSKKVVTTYSVDDISVEYTLNLTVEAPIVEETTGDFSVEETEDAPVEETEALEVLKEEDSIQVDTESAEAINMELQKEYSDAEQSIKDSRQKDMLKAGIVLGILALAFVVMVIVRAVSMISIKKCMNNRDSLTDGDMNSDYDEIDE